MAFNFVLYIAVLMIFYDLSAHFVYLIGVEKFFLKKKLNWWPEWEDKKYALFWTIYWGIVFLLLLIYILANF